MPNRENAMCLCLVTLAVGNIKRGTDARAIEVQPVSVG
jgi:hypothetical protein